MWPIVKTVTLRAHTWRFQWPLKRRKRRDYGELRTAEPRHGRLSRYETPFVGCEMIKTARGRKRRHHFLRQSATQPLTAWVENAISTAGRTAAVFSGPLAQLVEQWAFNPTVTGSSPVRPTARIPRFFFAIFNFRGRSCLAPIGLHTRPFCLRRRLGIASDSGPPVPIV